MREMTLVIWHYLRWSLKSFVFFISYIDGIWAKFSTSGANLKRASVIVHRWIPSICRIYVSNSSYERDDVLGVIPRNDRMYVGGSRDYFSSTWTFVFVNATIENYRPGLPINICKIKCRVRTWKQKFLILNFFFNQFFKNFRIFKIL